VTLDEALTEMVDALDPLTVEIPGLQITRYFNPVPTPPSIDIYPADPFQTGSGFGVGQKRVHWTVRARVSTADPAAASGLLLRLLDTQDPASVEAALADAGAEVGNDDTVSGFRTFTDDPTSELLGCEWRVGVYV
jgi:hypothetical protein